MRTLLLELRPATLEDVPLPELLQQLIDGVAARGKVAVDFQIEGDCDLPMEIRVAFFRTAQEAMNNVAKHSQASRVAITLQCQSDAAMMTIGDDGCGFALDKIPPNHIGLDIMRERAAAIDGDLSIETTPSIGTTVQLSWQRREE